MPCRQQGQQRHKGNKRQTPVYRVLCIISIAYILRGWYPRGAMTTIALPSDIPQSLYDSLTNGNTSHTYAEIGTVSPEEIVALKIAAITQAAQDPQNVLNLGYAEINAILRNTHQQYSRFQKERELLPELENSDILIRRGADPTKVTSVIEIFPWRVVRDFLSTHEHGKTCEAWGRTDRERLRMIRIYGSLTKCPELSPAVVVAPKGNRKTPGKYWLRKDLETWIHFLECCKLIEPVFIPLIDNAILSTTTSRADIGAISIILRTAWTVYKKYSGVDAMLIATEGTAQQLTPEAKEEARQNIVAMLGAILGASPGMSIDTGRSRSRLAEIDSGKTRRAVAFHAANKRH